MASHFSRALEAFSHESPSLTQNPDVIGQMGAWGGREQQPNKLWCEHCQKVVKTRSELKKHQQRHIKPFLCDEPECPRKQAGKQQGFSTKNDLERHKKTVHNNKVAGSVHYRCHLDQCKTKTKLWPRADNFRSHLKRIHGKDYTAEESLDEFVDRQATQCTQDDLEGVGGVVGPLYAVYPSDGDLEISPWTMDLDGSQDRIVTAGRETCQDDQERSELALEPARMQFAAPPIRGPRSGHNGIPRGPSRHLDLLQTSSLSIDSAASAQPPAPSPPAQINHSRLPMPPPETADKDGSRSFAPRRPNLGRLGEALTVSPAATSQIKSGRPALLPEVDNGATYLHHHSHQAQRPNAGTPAAAPPANSKKPVSSAPPNTADLHAPSYDRDGQNHEMACGSAASASASAPVKEAGDDVLQLLKNLTGLQGLEEEEIFKLLEHVPQQTLGKFMKKSSNAKKGSAATTPSTSASGAHRNGTTNTRDLHDCPDTNCDRKFARKCELKKHMKRHEKPYCCTFPPCTKRFGSKSDWKRHENTQHNQAEKWVCDMKKHNTPTEQCTKECYRRESFKQHLQKEHLIDDQNKLEEKFERCRVERGFDTKFWCGFCEHWFELTGQSPLKAQAERSSHMDEHFSGRNNAAKKEISEWKNADPDLPEMDLGSPVEDDDDDDDDEEEDEDEEEQCASPRSNPSSATSAENSQESRSAGSSPAKNKRRRAENEAAVSAVQARQSKRQRNNAETSQMWRCCQSDSSAVVKTTADCMGLESRCDHQRCDGCQILSHTPNESK